MMQGQEGGGDTEAGRDDREGGGLSGAGAAEAGREPVQGPEQAPGHRVRLGQSTQSTSSTATTSGQQGT